ncbi:MAG TPA: cupredoxin domain-containing protein [Sporichthya sp.]|nr:cupredoxin domain-containing protein [Sporichthya sp.]
MFRTPLAAAAAVALLVGLAACGTNDKTASSAPSTPQADTSTHTSTDHGTMAMVTMKETSFTPADLTVAPGAEVMVMNEGAEVHNLKDSHSKGKTFNSGDVGAGKSAMISAPTKPGNYPYECTYHFGMTGTLHVK